MTKQPIAKRIADWLAANGAVILALAVGFLLGALTVFPLGLHLPDPAASLIGSAFGAAAAVGGAAWLWNIQSARQENSAGYAIACQFSSAHAHANNAVLELRQSKFKDAGNWLVNMVNNYDETRRRIERMNGAIHLLSARQIKAFVIAELLLEWLKDEAYSLNLTLGLGPFPAGGAVAMRISEQTDKLEKLMTDLSVELDKLSPDWNA